MNASAALIENMDFYGHIIRIFDLNGEPVIARTDVAQALGYKSPRAAAAMVMDRNPEDFEGCEILHRLKTAGGNQEVSFLTERGVYTFAFLARTKKATEFRRRVAILLESIRRGHVLLVDPYRTVELEIEKIRATTDRMRAEIDQNRLSFLGSFVSSHGARVSPSFLSDVVQTIAGTRQHQARTYSSTEIAEHLSMKLNQHITANRIGRVASDLKIRPAPGDESDMVGWAKTIGRKGKVVYVPFYKETAVAFWENHFTLNPVNSRKRPLPDPSVGRLHLELSGGQTHLTAPNT